MEKMYLWLIMILVLVNLGFGSEKQKKEAEKLFGRVVFSSERTNDGEMYAYLLENGKITNLGLPTYAPCISPNGKLVSAFVDDRKVKNKKYMDLYIYNIKKRRAIGIFPIKYEQAYDHTWTRDGKYLIYGTKEELTEKDKEGQNLYNTYLMKIDIKTGKEEILKKYGKVDLGYNINDISISNDNKRLLLTIGKGYAYDNLKILTKIYVVDINGQNEKLVWILGTPLGWFPDNKHILIHTNRNPDGSKINETRGVLYKVNVDTGEKEIIEDMITHPYTTEKLSRDGRYIYSCRYNSYLTFNLSVGDLHNRKQEMMLTYPIPYEYKGEIRYSDDSSPDWWYELEK